MPRIAMCAEWVFLILGIGIFETYVKERNPMFVLFVSNSLPKEEVSEAICALFI